MQDIFRIFSLFWLFSRIFQDKNKIPGHTRIFQNVITMIISFRSKLSQISQNSQENTISNVGNCDDSLRKKFKIKRDKNLCSKSCGFSSSISCSKIGFFKNHRFHLIFELNHCKEKLLSFIFHAQGIHYPPFNRFYYLFT